MPAVDELPNQFILGLQCLFFADTDIVNPGIPVAAQIIVVPIRMPHPLVGAP